MTDYAKLADEVFQCLAYCHNAGGPYPSDEVAKLFRDLSDGKLVCVPAEPESERIESMCYRYDHGHGLPESFPEQETDEQWKRRQEANRSRMRQLYEEAIGHGFYPRNRAMLKAAGESP